MREIYAVMTIAYRDLMKFLRDPTRLVAAFIFPIFFVGVFGATLQANIGSQVHFNFLTFVFTGAFAQTLFQSTTQGIVSLIEDRENDFSQEIFVSPISRYSILLGKILGESLVAMAQGVALLLFGYVAGVRLSAPQVLALIPIAIAVALLGGAFGTLLVSLFPTQRAANQIVPFLIFPQFFLAGVFAPIQVLPWYLDIASRLSPMRYAVDLARGVLYVGSPEYPFVVLASPLFNLVVMAGIFVVCLVGGTALFVRSERNR